VAVRLMNDGVQMERDLSEKYQHLREDYQHQQEEIISLEEARKHKKKLF
jgi:5-methyltetrahydrofolate--homocysteine methyltransferase